MFLENRSLPQQDNLHDDEEVNYPCQDEVYDHQNDHRPFSYGYAVHPSKLACPTKLLDSPKTNCVAPAIAYECPDGSYTGYKCYLNSDGEACSAAIAPCPSVTTTWSTTTKKSTTTITTSKAATTVKPVTSTKTSTTSAPSPTSDFNTPLTECPSKLAQTQPCAAPAIAYACPNGGWTGYRCYLKQDGKTCGIALAPCTDPIEDE
ncbi:hypothetical protein HK097_008209 [Rhizophlyctis rosea]|uniref:Uncharacterized protein n=1 Tax=Rhizophlyctis rosea TaxID=64517 RepID=A0AAD5X9C3_9FUNG|nr:hypothetical protein HK097_008209 [Rhizophlyctis rosea]